MDVVTSKDDSPILNYDLARFVEHEDYIPFSFFVKGQARTLFIPAEMVNNRTLLERRKAISRASNLYNYAYGMIDPDKLADPQGVDGIAETVAVSAAGIISINLWEIFGAKWRATDDFPAIVIKEDSDICPASQEEADSIFSGAMTDRLVAKFKPELHEEIKSTYEASWFVWGHIFFSILYAMRRDHGVLDAIDPDMREVLFEQYKESDVFGEAFLRATHFWGREIARRWLEGKKPAEWSIESLMDFMGIEPSSDETENTYLATFKLTASQIEKLISSMRGHSPDTPAELSYNIIDGKVALTVNINTDASAADLSRLIAAAKAKKRMPRITRETFLSEGLAGAEALAREGKAHLFIKQLAEKTNRDRETIKTCAATYKEEWAAINEKFIETKEWRKRYKQR